MLEIATNTALPETDLCALKIASCLVKTIRNK